MVFHCFLVSVRRCVWWAFPRVVVLSRDPCREQSLGCITEARMHADPFGHECRSSCVVPRRAMPPLFPHVLSGVLVALVGHPGVDHVDAASGRLDGVIRSPAIPLPEPD